MKIIARPANLCGGKPSSKPFVPFKVSPRIQFNKARSFASVKKCIIGTDEAGLGALLGPVGIIQATVAAESTEAVNKAFADAHAGVEKKDIHVQGKRGKKLDLVGNFSEMETMALQGVQWLGGKVPENAAEFFAIMGEKNDDRKDPWMGGAADLKLPVSVTEVPKWNIPGVEPISWSGSLIHAPALNNARKEGVNRAVLELDHITKMLENLPKGFDEYEIYVDRLGGRKYYAEAIQKLWDGAFEVNIVEETQKKSVYSCVKGTQKRTISFPVNGEETTILIAVCSNIAKYARELHMKLFNNYWCGRFPDVKPTDGYHNDGKRWIRSITKRDATVLPPIRDVIIREGLEMGLTFPGFRF